MYKIHTKMFLFVLVCFNFPFPFYAVWLLCHESSCMYDRKQGNDKWLIQCARTLVIARRTAEDAFLINRDIHEGFCQNKCLSTTATRKTPSPENNFNPSPENNSKRQTI